MFYVSLFSLAHSICLRLMILQFIEFLRSIPVLLIFLELYRAGSNLFESFRIPLKFLGLVYVLDLFIKSNCMTPLKFLKFFSTIHWTSLKYSKFYSIFKKGSSHIFRFFLEQTYFQALLKLFQINIYLT